MHFIGIESVGKSVEESVKDTKGVKGTEVNEILKEICTGEILWHPRLLLASKGVSSTFLSRFSSISVTGL